MTNHILICGGYDQHLGWLNSVELYDITKNEWNKGPDMITPRADHCVAYSEGRVFAIGGATQGRFAINKMESLDLRTNQWVAMPSMPKAREEFGVGVVNNKIYVMCGADDIGNYIKTYDVFDMRNDRWETLTPPCDDFMMKYQLGTVTIGDNIISLGGRQGKKYLSSVDILHTTTNSVSNVRNMPTGRNSLAVTVIDNRYIWVLGGFGGLEYLNSIEIYDIDEDMWFRCHTQMTKTRSFPKAVTVGHKIYCVSGNVDYGKHTQMDILDTDTMTWECGSELPVHRVNHDAIGF